MNIHVKLFGALRSAAKTSELSLQVPDTPTVKTAISALVSDEQYPLLRSLLFSGDNADPRPNALILVAGREIGTLEGLDTGLNDGDELSLLPVAHGG